MRTRRCLKLQMLLIIYLRFDINLVVLWASVISYEEQNLIFRTNRKDISAINAFTVYFIKHTAVRKSVQF